VHTGDRGDPDETVSAIQVNETELASSSISPYETTEPVPSSAGGGSSAPADLPGRYQDLGCIAGGAFGEVRRVRDTILDRVLVMKVLRAPYSRSSRMRARFLAEAKVTANLQHPGIVTIHDRGELADGRLWYTMKEVRGRTLAEVIAEVHAASSPEGFREAPSGWTFRRLVDAFARISQAMAFAHSRGVVHRDLKPDNLMVGEFGEVLVMDWGLARHFDDPRTSEAFSEPPSSDAAAPQLTRHGEILGTPAYMPPEQALGLHQLHGPESDVYALGAILYQLLSGRPPYSGVTSIGIVRQVLGGPPTPLAVAVAASGGPPIPWELEAVCERAMRREIVERYPDAEALAREVVAWLDGARRREQALGILESARAQRPAIAVLRDSAAERRTAAQALLGDLRPFDPIEKKRPGWQLEDEAARLEVDAALLETAWLQTVHGALSLDSDMPEAHAMLAEHYKERLSAAEIAHHDVDAARFEALLRAHDRGAHAAFLRGEGAVTLVTDPPGAIVHIERYALEDRRLVPVETRLLGRTPLLTAPLMRGSYLLRIRSEGRVEVRYPVLIERGGHWDGCAPGDAEPMPIALPRERDLGPDDIYVPAGWCWTGGDPGAADSLPARKIWIDGFIARRFQVTNAEYLEFLNDLVAGGREPEALSACPRSQLGMADAGGDRLTFGRDHAGRFVPVEDELGRPFQPDWPVVLIDWHGAMAYARWLAERTGRPWRLPNELEIEKAARGVDGRHFPWGDHPDATFACVIDSHESEPGRVNVTEYPLDESPYGVRGMAGNARGWCMNVWRREGPPTVADRLRLEEPAADDPDFRSVKGGAWSSPLNYSRVAVRFGSRPALRRTSTGVRVVRSHP
jgi:serine/threonine protein kinase/formylglycine-generating enzyme required for sulfatase activity